MLLSHERERARQNEVFSALLVHLARDLLRSINDDIKISKNNEIKKQQLNKEHVR